MKTVSSCDSKLLCNAHGSWCTCVKSDTNLYCDCSKYIILTMDFSHHIVQDWLVFSLVPIVTTDLYQLLLYVTSYLGSKPTLSLFGHWSVCIWLSLRYVFTIFYVDHFWSAMNIFVFTNIYTFYALVHCSPSSLFVYCEWLSSYCSLCSLSSS